MARDRRQVPSPGPPVRFFVAQISCFRRRDPAQLAHQGMGGL